MIYTIGFIKGISFAQEGERFIQEVFLDFFQDNLQAFFCQSDESLIHLMPTAIKENLGRLTLNKLINEHAICFSKIATADVSFTDLQVILFIYMHTVQDFLDYFWLVKDNSFLCSDVLVWNDQSTVRSHARFSLTTAEGSYAKTTISTEEIQQALVLYKNYNHLLNFNEVQVQLSDILNTEKSIESKIDYSNNKRIARAFEMITEARKCKVLAPKISFYITALESLFTCQKDASRYGIGVSNAVATRVSLLLGEDGSRNSEIYLFIKTCYKLRSKFVHGNPIGTDLFSYVSRLDSLLRRTMLDILTNHTEINDYHDNKILLWVKEFL